MAKKGARITFLVVADELPEIGQVVMACNALAGDQEAAVMVLEFTELEPPEE